MSQRLLPAPEMIARLLSGLLGRSVAVKASAAAAKPLGPACLAARYAEPGGGIEAVIVFDLPAAAALGAALTMFPPNVAQAAARAGRLEEGLLDSFREICNVMSRLAGDGQAATPVLADVAPLALARPRDIDKLLPTVSGRADYEIAVSGYADGRLVVLFG